MIDENDTHNCHKESHSRFNLHGIQVRNIAILADGSEWIDSQSTHHEQPHCRHNPHGKPNYVPHIGEKVLTFILLIDDREVGIDNWKKVIVDILLIQPEMHHHCDCKERIVQ